MGHQVESIDPLGTSSTRQYYPDGELKQISNPVGCTTNYQYDKEEAKGTG